MPIAIEQALQVLQAVVQSLPVGTNLALLHLMWGILNGSFLSSRGAIFPALQDNGFPPRKYDAVGRRCVMEPGVSMSC